MMDRTKYPPNWDEISQRIRDRAGNKCEKCGVANGLTIWRSRYDPTDYAWDNGTCFISSWGYPISDLLDYRQQAIKVVLTVGHLNHDPSDNRDENLKAMCQRCHLNHDRKDNQRRKRRNKQQRYERLQPALPGIE